MHFAWQFSVSLICADNGLIVEGRSLLDILLPIQTRGRYEAVSTRLLPSLLSRTGYGFHWGALPSEPIVPRCVLNCEIPVGQRFVRQQHLPATPYNDDQLLSTYHRTQMRKQRLRGSKVIALRTDPPFPELRVINEDIRERWIGPQRYYLAAPEA